MEKVIDEKKYDTETATLVAKWANDWRIHDCRHCEKTMYLTPNGIWFIAGSGGPLTAFATPVEGGWTAGSDLYPLSLDQARRTLENWKAVNALEKYFSIL